MKSQYAVLVVVLFVWLGIFICLLKIERRIKRLEDKK